VADGVLDRRVHLGIRLAKALGLKHGVPPKLVVPPRRHDAAVGAADEDDGLGAGALGEGGGRGGGREHLSVSARAGACVVHARHWCA
jgi:hypothetical protein